MFPDDADKPSDLFFDEKGWYNSDPVSLPLYEGEPGTSQYLNRRLATESMTLSHLLGNQATTPTSAAYLESPPQIPLNVRLPPHLSPPFQNDDTREWSPYHSPGTFQPSVMAPCSPPSCLLDASSGFPEVDMTRAAPISDAFRSLSCDRPVVNDHQLLHQKLRSSPPPRCLPPRYSPHNYPPPDHPPPNYLSRNHPSSDYPPPSYPPPRASSIMLTPLSGRPASASRSASLSGLRPFASAISQRPGVQTPQFISPTPMPYRSSYDLAACYPYPSGNRVPESMRRSFSMPLLSQTSSIVPTRSSGSLHGEVSPAATPVGSLSATRVSQVSSSVAREANSLYEEDSDAPDDEMPPTAEPSSIRQTQTPHNLATSPHLPLLRVTASAGLSWQEPLVGCLKTRRRATSTAGTVAQPKRTVDGLDNSDASEEPAKKRTKIQTSGKSTDDAVRSQKYRAKHKNFGERVKEELGDELPKNPTREDYQETLLEKYIELRTESQEVQRDNEALRAILKDLTRTNGDISLLVGMP